MNQQIQRQQKRMQAAKKAFKTNRKEIISEGEGKTAKTSFFKKVYSFLSRDKHPPETTQDTIRYKRMFKDGICYLGENRYNKQLEFLDVNYQLAKEEDKSAIFGNYCTFLNYFDSNISVQLTFVNQKVGNEAETIDSIHIEEAQDDFNTIRKEYGEMLKRQLSKGNNGLQKRKYITFTIEADSYKQAKARLERIETDLINNFKTMGVRAIPMDGKARLKLLHDMLHIERQEPFSFTWKKLKESGLDTKDVIAPSGFNFSNYRTFQIGKTKSTVCYLKLTASELSDKMLADFLDMDCPITINFHIRSVDQVEAIKDIKRKLSDIDKMKIEEQKKAVKAGYDMDIIPSDLATYGADAQSLLEDLQSRNERMFIVTILLQTTASTIEKLEDIVFQVSGIAQKYNCSIMRLDYQQEDGLCSSLPLGANYIEANRTLTTSTTAIFIPFTTQELFQTHKGALYCGINAVSNNMIIVDRKLLKNPNGLILGTPGSGKSFSAKREMTNVFLSTDDDILIVDPESEYRALVEALGGQVIRIDQNSTQYINPFDINLEYSDDENPISLKSAFILSLCELIVGGRIGLEPTEMTIVDRAVRQIYRKYLEDPKPENVPVFQDLYNTLLKQKEEEAERLATSLEIYVTGSLNVFNHRTNVDIDNRIVCYDIKGLGKQLKKIGMLVVQDQIWNRVTLNRSKKKSTRSYIDEFHLLLKEDQTASYSVEIWKRFRKWGGIPTGITQNVKDLLSSREVENIFENSDFIYMLNQATGDRQILAKQLSISDQELSFVTNSGEGEGLLFYGSIIIPFIDRFPKDTKLYKVMTTKLSEGGAV